MNESFFVKTIFNLLIVSIGSCCLNLLFSSSVKFLNKLYKIVLWLVLIGFYEPYFNFSNGSSLIGNSYQLKTSSLIKRYNLSNSNLNNLTYLTDNFIKFGILLTNIILFGIIFMRWLTSGYFPISNLYESLMFLTWCLLTLLSIAGYKIGFSRISVIGCVILPLCLFLIGFSIKVLPISMQSVTPLVPALQSSWLLFHVSMMMLSYSVLLFGSLLSIMFLFLYSKTSSVQSNLKKKLYEKFFIVPT
jgi:ABC-type transport system involved in cytochrome c biogenesis permease subunit